MAHQGKHIFNKPVIINGELTIGNGSPITGIDKDSIGLGSVDNTSDLAKPISTATQSALDFKSDKATTYTKTETDIRIQTAVGSGGSVSLDSPAFTGIPTAPTALSGTSSTQIATTAFVTAAVGSVTGGTNYMDFGLITATPDVVTDYGVL